MTQEKTREYGFTGKVTTHKSGFYLLIPKNTVQSADLEDEDLIHLTIRNQDGRKEQVSRKVRESGEVFKAYLPKGISQDLGLTNLDLVDCFFRTD